MPSVVGKNIMAAKYIFGSMVAAIAVSKAVDVFVYDNQLFGGKTPITLAPEWWAETDKKFQAWPRTAGPPVVMNPITRQNFIVKSQGDS